jgi:hypothetical protein
MHDKAPPAKLAGLFLSIQIGIAMDFADADNNQIYLSVFACFLFY